MPVLFLVVTGMVMLVRSVIAAVVMIVIVFAGLVAMLVLVLMVMFMSVRVPMFVAVLLVAMRVFVGVPMGMFMTVLVPMFMFSFHTGLLSWMVEMLLKKLKLNLIRPPIASISCLSFPGYFILENSLKK